MKVVLDTNVWLSGLFWQGKSSKIMELAEKEKIKIFLSKQIIFEIVNVLNKEAKFQKFLKEREQKIKDLIRTILSIGNLIKIKSKVKIVEEDPSDNMVLEVALDGKVKYVVSYDKHLLNLKKFKGIRIIRPAKFLRLIKR